MMEHRCFGYVLFTYGLVVLFTIAYGFVVLFLFIIVPCL